MVTKPFLRTETGRDKPGQKKKHGSPKAVALPCFGCSSHRFSTNLERSWRKWILSPIITKDDEFNSYSSLRTHPQSLASLCLKPQNFENYVLSRILFLHSYMGCRRWNYTNDSEIESFHYLPFEFVAIQVQWKSSLHSNGDKPHEYLPLVCWEKTIQKAIKSTCTREFC